MTKNQKQISCFVCVLLLFAALSVSQAQQTALTDSDGSSPQGEYVFKTLDERELKIHLHYPPDWKPTNRHAVIIFFFGGGWNNGTVAQFETQAEYFASRGLVAARADYRVKSRDDVTPDKCVEDARSAVRWLRKNAGRLGIDPARLIASGGSAGGHLAACTMIPNSVDAPGDDRSISTIPQALVLFNPVLNLTSERMIGRVGGDQSLARKISPTLHLDKNTPPALILYGSDDRLKTHGDAYRQKAKTLNVRVDEYVAEGQGHGFFNRSPWRERTLIAADKFLAALGLLEGEPTIYVPSDQASAAPRRRHQGSARTNAQNRAGVENGSNNSGRNPGGGSAARVNRRTMSTEALLKRAPEGVTVVPDIAYRAGNAAWKLDLAMPSDRGSRPRPN